MAVRSYVRPSPATTGSRMTQSEMGHKISSGSASPRLAAKAAAWSPGEEGGGGGLLTLGHVGGVGLVDLTRGLACGFACGTCYEEVSHAWRDRPTPQPL
jgi:hypothetical protein